MKEKKLIPNTVISSRSKSLFLIVLTLLCTFQVLAQQKVSNDFSIPGEKLSFKAYFKWGALMVRAGKAEIDYSSTEAGFRSRLFFATAPFFDGIFKMRDTLDVHFDSNMNLIAAQKRVKEGKIYTIDKLYFKAKNPRVEVKANRVANGVEKIDTLMLANGLSLDIVGAIQYLRSVAWENCKPKQQYAVNVYTPKGNVRVIYVYQGKEELKLRSGDRYRAHKISVNVYDKTFSKSNEAVTAWVSDDSNRIPLRIKTDLKIGAADVHLMEARGLLHPSNSKLGSD